MQNELKISIVRKQFGENFFDILIWTFLLLDVSNVWVLRKKMVVDDCDWMKIFFFDRARLDFLDRTKLVKNISSKIRETLAKNFIFIFNSRCTRKKKPTLSSEIIAGLLYNWKSV